MDNLQLYLLMREIVTRVTTIPTVILADPNAPSPGGEYCAISANQTKTQRGQAIQRDVDSELVDSPIGPVSDIDVDVRAQIYTDMVLDFYRGGAHDYAAMMHQVDKLPNIQAYLFENKVGWFGVQNFIRLDALQSEDYESRAQVTIRLGYELRVSERINAIYQIPVEVENESGDTLIDFTINEVTT